MQTVQTGRRFRGLRTAVIHGGFDVPEAHFCDFSDGPFEILFQCFAKIVQSNADLHAIILPSLRSRKMSGLVVCRILYYGGARFTISEYCCESIFPDIAPRTSREGGVSSSGTQPRTRLRRCARRPVGVPTAKRVADPFFCGNRRFRRKKNGDATKRTSVNSLTGVALFVPKLAFTGESSTLRIYRISLTALTLFSCPPASIRCEVNENCTPYYINVNQAT